MEYGNGYGEKKSCGTVNFYCGDGGHHPHPKPPKQHCWEGPVEFVSFADIGFIAPVGSDIPSQLLINPVGSGKTIYVKKRLMTAIGSDDENILFKFYLDPTIVANGAVGTISGLSAPAGGPSVAQFYMSPTITVGQNGTPIDAMNVSTPPFESDLLLAVGEGHSLLVTVRANAENTRASAFIYWKECPIHMHEEHMEG